jgi:hypothetical protein
MRASFTICALAVTMAAISGARAQNFSPDELTRRRIERRAVEAVIWGMPAVNTDLMLQAMTKSAKGAPNQIAYWQYESRLLVLVILRLQAH